MKKNLFFAALALVALASCSDEQFVNENNNSPNPAFETGEKAIVFNSGTSAITRAAKTGAEAADSLNKNFIFAGIKGASSTYTSPITYVFDQYNANWIVNTANTTQSNSNDWEYVGYDPDATSSLPTGSKQTIKYWDYAQKQYDFAAYSFGLGDKPNDLANSTFARAQKINFKNLGSKTDAVFTLTGSAKQLKACYISDLVTAYNRDGVSDYGNVVTFSFRSLATKVRMAFYETLPGYSVKDIQFYSVESGGSSSTTPTLFASSPILPSGSGTMKITYPTVGFDKRPNATGADTDYNKAHVSFTNTSSSDLSSTLTFEALADYAKAESQEGTDATGWIGRASNAATYAGGLENGGGKYYTILPFEAGANLTLRIKYTLVSTDGSGETMTVDNATAVVPAELARWSPNYAYTYIFKISDMTNGSTGVDGNNQIITGLTPITLNAVVVDNEDGVQETITTVSKPSITTYAEGKVVTVNDEYVSGVPIYVIVFNATSNETLSDSNVKLFTAEVGADALQGITEESVDNAYRYGEISGSTYTVTDAAGEDLVLTDVTSTLPTFVKKIDAGDSPTGNEIELDATYNKAAKFTPAASTVYVFQYLVQAETNSPTYTVVPTVSSTLTANDAYFTSSNGEGGSFVATGNEKLDGVYYTKEGSTYTQVSGITKLTAGVTYYSSTSDAVGFTATGNELVGGTYYTRTGTDPDYTYHPVGKLEANKTYYTSQRGAGKFVATGSEWITANTYWSITAGDDEHPAKYQYKIIKVQ